MRRLQAGTPAVTGMTTPWDRSAGRTGQPTEVTRPANSTNTGLATGLPPATAAVLTTAGTTTTPATGPTATGGQPPTCAALTSPTPRSATPGWPSSPSARLSCQMTTAPTASLPASRTPASSTT